MDPHEPHHETDPLHDSIDQWHDHTKDPKPLAAHAEVANAKAIFAIGIGLFVTVLVTVLVIYLYYVWFTTRTLNERSRAYEPQNRPEFASLSAKRAAVKSLHDPKSHWIDHDTVAIPLDRAMDEVIERYKNRSQ